MIEINLLPGKKKKAAGGGAGFKLALPDFRGLLASIKNPWLLAASAASLIVVGGGLLWFITQSTRLRVAQNRRIEVQAEKRRFDAVIAQKRQSERIRDSLVAEINVIRGIDADRYIWPPVLDQIPKALPPYTWLTGISAAGGGNVAPGSPGSLPVGPGVTDSTGRPQVRIWITGSTVDIQAFTTFLRQLAASPWLTDVMPATTSTIIEADRPVTAFNVAVRFRVADSVYIRTVPLTQSARERHGLAAAGPTEPGDDADYPGYARPRLRLLELLGEADGRRDRGHAGRDQEHGGRDRAGEGGSRERHRGGPAPQGRGVLRAARGDAPARAREKRSPGPDRRHLDQGQGARRDDRPDRAPARRAGAPARPVTGT